MKSSDGENHRNGVQFPSPPLRQQAASFLFLAGTCKQLFFFGRTVRADDVFERGDISSKSAQKNATHGKKMNMVNVLKREWVRKEREGLSFEMKNGGNLLWNMETRRMSSSPLNVGASIVDI